LTFNGEIYNFIELRQELAAHGARFKTESDSEVLLQAYAVWGHAMLDRLLGMFAFVIYDTREQRLFAARDRFGIKPLHYLETSQGIAFASEIKQLIHLPGFSSRMNLARAYDFLEAGYSNHTEDTMFASVRQLRGGQFANVDLRNWRPGAGLPIKRYYDIPREPGPPMSESAAAERFAELFDDSVRLHLRADVRTGSCLSGGLDSSAIVATMSRLLDRCAAEPVQTISACYFEKEVDERPFIEAVTASAYSQAHFVFPDPQELFAEVEKIAWHQDEPFESTSIYAQWCVFGEARRQGIKVMLDGQGADEQLAGYHHPSFWYHTRSLVQRWDIFGLARMMWDRKRFHGLPFKDQLLELPGRPRLRRRMTPARVAGEGWLGGRAFEEVRRDPDPFQALLAREAIGQVDDIGDLCVAYVKNTLPKLLRYEDRNSMAHSIEARIPFLDHRLVDFNIRLWDRHKIVGGDTKRVLRRAMADRLPPKVLYRRDKLAFTTPESRWFRGPMRPEIEVGIQQSLELYPELFDAQEVAALVASVFDGRRSGAESILWRIISLGVWGAVFKVSL
jgi:asparagine synthase (glutamine-hydrolysing)